MKIQKVKELMIPLSEYATVNEDDTLEKAVKTLCDS
ncbi:MAG: CBS domain-containing protein, partial [Desulfobacula sp.]|nr:CBS domain-containing protein [Desulfobacula sp.]